MPTYQTRRMVALRQFAHGALLLRHGDEFPCSELDAGYYLTKGMAREAEAPAPAVDLPTEVPRRRGRPPKFDAPAPAVDSGEFSAPQMAGDNDASTPAAG